MWAINSAKIIRSDINKTKVRGVTVETVTDGPGWEPKLMGGSGYARKQ